MKCEHVERLLTEDISKMSDGIVAEHLASCEKCCLLSEDLLALEGLTLEMGTAVPDSQSLRQALLQEASRIRSSRRFFLKPLLVGLVLIGSTGILPTTELVPVPPAENVEMLYRTDPGVPNVLRNLPYVDVILTQSPRGDRILRLPSIIEVRRTDLHEDFYFNNVSH